LQTNQLSDFVAAAGLRSDFYITSRAKSWEVG
jgi:hypothetical protein